MNRAAAFSRVPGNALANLLRMGASWIVVLLLPPLLVRVLDKPTYATWVLILQIGAYVTLIDVGIQSAIGRFVARAEGLRDRRSMGQAMSSAGLILAVAALASAAAALVCAWQLPRLFHSIPASIVPGARTSLLVVGFSLALSLPFSTFAGAFLGLQMNYVNAIAGSVGKLAGAAGAAWAAWRHQGMLVMALWIGAGNLLQSAIYCAWWFRLRIRGVLRRVFMTGAAIREFSVFCVAMFAVQLASLLITGMDMPVVAAFDFRAAAYYAVAATVSSMLIAPHTAIVTTLIPVASGLSATETPERIGRMVLKTTRYGNAILCLLTLPLLFAMRPFLRLWVGADYAVHVLPLAVILVVAQFIRLALLPYAAVAFAAGQQQRMLISPMVEGVVNLACSVAGAYFLGALGVALGTLIGAVVGVLLHFVNSMPRTDCMTFSRRRLALTAMARPVACCLPSLLLLLAVFAARERSPVELAAIALGELLAAFVIWRGNFQSGERDAMIDIARKTFGSVLRLAGARA
jgi:O-antigen/teichoic acid export membrane protein